MNEWIPAVGERGGGGDEMDGARERGSDGAIISYGVYFSYTVSSFFLGF